MSSVNAFMCDLIVRYALPLIVMMQLCAPSFAQDSTPNLSREVTQTQGEQSEPIKLAVVVGIDDYSSLSGVSRLNYAVADARSLKKSLESQGYSVLALYNGEATAQFIRKAIEKITQLAENEQERSNASLIFSFSGHGFAVDDENYLVTYDTDSDNVTGSGYPLSELVDLLDSTGISQKILFIDACRNNPGQRSSSASFVQQKAEGVGILFSTRAGDVAYESSIVGGGIFSHFLVEGLNGEAANAEGIVSLHSLRRYVERKVPEWTIENLQVVQTPYQAGEYTGEFRLARSQIRPAEQDPIPANPRTFLPIKREKEKDRLPVLLNPISELAQHFSDELSRFLSDNYDVDIVDNEQAAALVVDISTSDLEISRSGQSFVVEGDLLLEGYSVGSGKNELSQEFVSVKGISYKNERLAVSAAAKHWTDSMGFGSTTTVIKQFIQKLE